MKKIIFLITLVISFYAEAQTLPNIPGVTNRKTREQIIDGHFFNGIWIPLDTIITSDSGLIAYKGGNFQFKLPTNWAPMPNLILTNPHVLDQIVLGDIAGRTLINLQSVPGSGTRFLGVPTIVDLGNLQYFVNTNGPYIIDGIQYPSASGVVTLPIGNAGVDSGRVDQIVATAAGVGSIQGDNSDNPVAKVVDALTTLEIGTVLILENNSTPAVVSTDVLITDQNAGSPTESVITTTATINANSTTNPFHSTKTISITGFTTAQRINFANAAGTLSKLNYTNINGYIRINNAWNNATQYSVQLINGTQVSNSVPLTTWGITKTLTGSYQHWAIPMSAFTGSPDFTAIRIVRTGTGGTTNWLLDYVQLQNTLSVTTTTPPVANTIYTGNGVLNSDRIVRANNHEFTMDSVSVFRVLGQRYGDGSYSSVLVVDQSGAISGQLNDPDGHTEQFAMQYGLVDFLAADGIPTHNSEFQVLPTSLSFLPFHGVITIDTVQDGTGYDKQLVWNSTTGDVGMVAFSGGGGSDSPDRINGTATAGVTADLGANQLDITADDGAGNTNHQSQSGAVWYASASFSDGTSARIEVDQDHTYPFLGYNDGATNLRTFWTEHGLVYGSDISATYTSLSLITRGDAPQILTGVIAPASTPTKVGDIYVDTSAKKLYFATGTSSSADWTIAN